MTATTFPKTPAAISPAGDAAAADLERRYGAANYHPLPVTLQRGAGVWLFDTAGRRYLDMMSAYSAVSFGHGHPALVKALTEQASRLRPASVLLIAPLPKLCDQPLRSRVCLFFLLFTLKH